MLVGRIEMPDGRIILRDGCVVTFGGNLRVAADETVAASNAGTSTRERRGYAGDIDMPLTCLIHPLVAWHVGDHRG